MLVITRLVRDFKDFDYHCYADLDMLADLNDLDSYLLSNSNERYRALRYYGILFGSSTRKSSGVENNIMYLNGRLIENEHVRSCLNFFLYELPLEYVKQLPESGRDEHFNYYSLDQWCSLYLTLALQSLNVYRGYAKIEFSGTISGSSSPKYDYNEFTSSLIKNPFRIHEGWSYHIHNTIDYIEYNPGAMRIRDIVIESTLFRNPTNDSIINKTPTPFIKLKNPPIVKHRIASNRFDLYTS